MLTNNFFALAKLGNAGVRYSGNKTYQIPDAIIKNTDGMSNSGWGYHHFQINGAGTDSALACAMLTRYYDGFKLAVGTGSGVFDPAMYTLTDMMLSQPIAQANIAVDAAGRLTLSATITNGRTENYTISEVGYVPKLAIQTASRNEGWNVLLARQLLDVPVTLAPGESATVTMTVDW